MKPDVSKSKPPKKPQPVTGFRELVFVPDNPGELSREAYIRHYRTKGWKFHLG